MNYEFALDKKALISLIAGSVMIGVLLFLAGWIVGWQWTVAASAESASTKTSDDVAELPKEPVLREDASAPHVETPMSAKPKLFVPKEAVAAPAQANAATAGASQLPIAQPAGDVRIIESTEDETAAANEKLAAE